MGEAKDRQKAERDERKAFDDGEKKGERSGFKKGARRGLEDGQRTGLEEGYASGLAEGERRGLAKGLWLALATFGEAAQRAKPLVADATVFGLGAAHRVIARRGGLEEVLAALVSTEPVSGG